MNSRDGKRCPGYKFEVTATRASNVRDRRPGLCVYEKGVDKKHYTKDGNVLANLGYAHMFIDVKGRGRTDFFKDPSPLKENDENDIIDRANHQFVLNVPASQLNRARLDLGQIVAYATEACSRQHRQFYFSISLTGVKARLIRWDRSGAIATESFNLHENPELLCEFLWRFAHGTDLERGFDNTVARVKNPTDVTLFKNVISQHVQLQTRLSGKELDEALTKHYDPERVAVIQVFEGGSTSEGNIHQYLISRPVVSPYSMASRASRGYWAVSRETQKVVFIKDTWRYDTGELSKEGDIIQTLTEKGVSNIPELIHHGDVPLYQIVNQDHDDSSIGMSIIIRYVLYLTACPVYQATRNDRFFNAEWVCGTASKYLPRLVPHAHYRLVLGTVGYSLDHLQGTDELLRSTFDAYTGKFHVQSFEYFGLLM